MSLVALADISIFFCFSVIRPLTFQKRNFEQDILNKHLPIWHRDPSGVLRINGSVQKVLSKISSTDLTFSNLILW